MTRGKTNVAAENGRGHFGNKAGIGFLMLARLDGETLSWI
jgi:hypothetical protein